MHEKRGSTACTHKKGVRQQRGWCTRSGTGQHAHTRKEGCTIIEACCSGADTVGVHTAGAHSGSINLWKAPKL